MEIRFKKVYTEKKIKQVYEPEREDEMELQTVLEKRRSIREYRTDKVEDDKIREIIRAGILAPSWKNSQVTRYYAVRSEEMLGKVREALPEFNQKNTKNAPLLLVTTIVTNRSGFNPDGTPSNELGNGWGIYDAGLQNSIFLLSAAEEGVDSLVMGIRDADAIRGILHIPENECILSVIALGERASGVEKPRRKEAGDIVKFY